MNDRAALEAEVEGLIAYADGVTRDDDELFDLRRALVRKDPPTALEIGEGLLVSEDPDRREMGVDLVGVAAQVQTSLREGALPILRRVVEHDAEVGPLSAAILHLGHLNDKASHDAVLTKVEHPDPVVRHVVAFALPSVGLDEAALAGLRRLMLDEDDDVRDWATFGLAALTDADDEGIREALLARVEDRHYDTRIEAIVGLARRQEERVRPHLIRELAEPDHAVILDDATDFLDNGTGRDEMGDRLEHLR